MKTLKIFYDFEFIENGLTIDPISLGMVCEDGREYYAVFEDSLHRPGFYMKDLILLNPWLLENVFPSLPYFLFQGQALINYDHPDEINIKRREVIKQDILDFTAGFEPELWAWYGDYDHVALCQIFGKMIDLPPNFPMFTNDIRQFAGNRRFELPRQPSGVHNALEDARHNKVRYDFLVS